MRILVLGLGNLLMNDDAAGLKAVYRLKKIYEGKFQDKLKIMDGGTLGLDLLPYIEEATHLIIVDAVDLDLSPGTVIKIEGDDIDSVFENKLSPHQMGLKDILFAADIIGVKPEYVVMYGIQIGNVNMENQLSLEVMKSLDHLVKNVQLEIEKLLKLL
ncbi:hydrogenase maturation protease [Deferribacter autotrophicus]|uniref:Hydrogenase maturation protease n=1 Tax=Deferribacter autotrophicus TaxID=500465 RepID=A0A5A8F7C7_9BACT|nr:HyaD/HybD family hydrogenase maturation endopeptidase [Deferribacter autotrophicus]KAA0258908.1 hydrogenase maturation protease [Deferribacter autotrophicus]